MKKKIISAAAAAACVLAIIPQAMAEVNPAVEVNDREIVFADQKAVILEDEGRTMIPVRGVFEYMGANVKWNDETKTASIYLNGKQVDITIGNPTMKVYTYSAQNLFAAPEKEEVTVDAAPQIINDRTMIPLRAVSEALGTNVEWDDTSKTVRIYTKNYEKPVIDNSAEQTGETVTQNPVLSISADKTTAAVGDTVEVTVSLKNIPADSASNSYTLGFVYDHSKLEYEANSIKLVNADITKYLNVENAEFTDDSLKLIGITIDESAYVTQEGAYATLTFKVLSDEQSTITLSNRYSGKLGWDNNIGFIKNDEYVESDETLVLNTTPITIN